MEFTLERIGLNDLYIFDGAIINSFSVKNNVFFVDVEGEFLLPRVLGIKGKIDKVGIYFYDISYIEIESVNIQISLGEKPLDEKKIQYFGGAWNKPNGPDFGWEIYCLSAKLVIEKNL